jgi:hypothetical protein
MKFEFVLRGGEGRRRGLGEGEEVIAKKMSSATPSNVT